MYNNKSVKIIFLGTSAGWPLPRLGCICKICSSEDSKDNRLRPAVFVNDSILLDAPIDIYHEIGNCKLKIENLRYILLTHTHPDHINGLYDLTHIYNQQEKPTIITTEGILKEVRRNFGIPLGGAFKTLVAKPQQEIIINGIKIWYIPVEHGLRETYGIKLKERKILFYAPEFRKILPSVRRNISGIDLLILDGSSLGKAGQTRGHENIEEGIKLGKILRIKMAVFTNIGHKTLPHKELGQFVKEHGGKNFGIAFDGLEMTL